MNTTTDTQGTYVCYDIRGIQQYIFAVPNLKCIIGGSALIDRFDRETAAAVAGEHGAEFIFGGGGRGTLHCMPGVAVDELVEGLIRAARECGLDLRISRSGSLAAAAAGEQALYSFVPDSLEGQPCRMSGLWPVAEGTGHGRLAGVHPAIAERFRRGREDPFGRRILERLKNEGRLPQPLQDDYARVRFMRNVNPDEEDDTAERKLAARGSEALGSRNRWAIIAMDGNDMGSQHRVARERFGSEGDRWSRWLREMSQALHACTEDAVIEALGEAIHSWWSAAGRELNEGAADEPIVLPFRPLLVGGDDVLILAHVSHAMELARGICGAFERRSQEQAEARAGLFDLWPATGNRLTISGGILYAGVSFPLAAGIRYAESLQSGAKAEGRNRGPGAAGEPSPAAIDWEQLTEKAIDTPQARRSREMRFVDEDRATATEVRLTQRPWLVEDLERELLPLIERLKQWKVPRSIQHELLGGLRQPFWDRRRFLLRLAKQHPRLVELLHEDYDRLPARDGRGWRSGGTAENPLLTTPVPDAVLLMQEEHRMSRETAS